MKLRSTLRKATELGIGLSALATLVLAGCGGGGASSNGGVAATQVSGVAAKGIIKYAVVTAYELDTHGNIVRTVGNSETDATGKYSLTIGSSYTGGPIKLVLTPKSDGSTLMVCDVAAGCGTDPVTNNTVVFGGDVHLPPAFALAAYQPSVSLTNATVTSQITPYTNMVAANVQSAVQAGATLNNDLVSIATSKISTLVGVNISTTEPVDITNASAVAAASANSLQYGAFNAAIGDIAFANSNGFASGVQAVADAFADGQFDSSDAVTIADITTAVQSEVTTTPTLSTTSNTAGTASVTDQLTVIADSTTSGTYSPTPTATATMSPLAQAKALVSQTRTWVTQIAALQTPAAAFGNNVSIAGAVLNSNSAVLGGVFGQMLGQALNTVQMTASTTGLAAQTYTYPISYWNGTAMVSGTGSVVVSVASNNTLTLTLPSATTAGVTTTGTVTTTIPSSILGVPTTSLNLGTTNTMTITGTASMSSPAARITLNNATLSVALKAAGNTSNMMASNIASLGINGDITMEANGVSFNGTGEFDLVANSVANAVKPFSLSKIALGGTFTDNTTTPASSANASASVTFNNAATFDVIGLLSHQPVVWVNSWQSGDPFGVATAFAAANPGTTLQSGSYNQYDNQTCGYYQDASGLYNYGCYLGDTFGLTAKIQSAFSASYPTANGIQNAWANYDATYGTNYGGMLTFPDFESASNFANVTITVSSNVALAGNPAATLTVTANRTAYGSSANPFAGDVVALLAFNGQSVKFQASNTGTTAGTLTITNPDGVAMVLSGTAGSATGTVSASGTQVGTISTSGGIKTINYTDGTFESLH